MATPTLTTQSRKVFGRKVKALRREGLLPANIFGKKIKSTAIQVDQLEFSKLFQEVGETNIVTLKLKGTDDKSVLVSNLQKDPVTDLPLHVDFHQVDLKKKVTATVPLETIGDAPAVKEKGGVLFTTHNELEVEALPMDLPNKLELNLSSLKEIGDSLLVKDIKIDKSKVKILIDTKETIAVIQEQKAEEEVPAPEAEAIEGEEGAEAPAEEAAEGEDKKEDKPEATEGKEEAKAESKESKPASPAKGKEAASKPASPAGGKK